MASRIEMTRHDLYDLVWSMPLARAAATLGMAHLTLKKLCQESLIRLPPTGSGERAGRTESAIGYRFPRRVRNARRQSPIECQLFRHGASGPQNRWPTLNARPV
jgi:hypothetical protein